MVMQSLWNGRSVQTRLKTYFALLSNFNHNEDENAKTELSLFAAIDSKGLHE
jgi:hypothetical protein